MLKASFCLFPGIGESAEQRLWQSGVSEWNHVLRWPKPIFSRVKWEKLKECIDEANTAYDAGLLDYFLNRLPGVHKARILPEGCGHVGYLDIETDGLGKGAQVTTIAFHCAGSTRVFVRGVDLSGFLSAVGGCKLLVTYNGSSFDLPCLRRLFQIDLGLPHLDLMHVLRGMGCRGGLKMAEKTLGVKRRYSEGIGGEDAVVLWKRYRQHQDHLHFLLLII